MTSSEENRSKLWCFPLKTHMNQTDSFLTRGILGVFLWSFSKHAQSDVTVTLLACPVMNEDYKLPGNHVITRPTPKDWNTRLV